MSVKCVPKFTRPNIQQIDGTIRTRNCEELQIWTERHMTMKTDTKETCKLRRCVGRYQFLNPIDGKCYSYPELQGFVHPR